MTSICVRSRNYCYLKACDYTDDGGQSFYNFEHRYHRPNDLPARVTGHGTQKWFVNGMKHREGKPSAIYPDEIVEWFQYDMPWDEHGIGW